MSFSLAAASVLFIASIALALVLPKSVSASCWLALVPTVAVWGFIAIGGLLLPRRKTNPCPTVVPVDTTLFVNWIFVCLVGFVLAFAKVGVRYMFMSFNHARMLL